jgi:hypothetical protein
MFTVVRPTFSLKTHGTTVNNAVIFWVATPYSLVGVNHYFGGLSCLHRQTYSKENNLNLYVMET